MPFFLEHYLRALAARRRWLPIILLLPLFYLAVAAARQDLFVIEQDFTVDGAPVPALHQALQAPADWLLDETALAALERKLHAVLPPHERPAELWRLIETTLSLSLTEHGQPRLRYTGYNPALGGVLIDFFSQRLTAQGALERDGPPRRSAQRALWRDYRLMPALTLSALSLGAFLLVVTLRELLDPSFKSERQMARYLGLPMLGTLPDTDQLASRSTFVRDSD